MSAGVSDDLGLTRGELDLMQCGLSECDADHGPLFIHGRCHIESATWASYHKAGYIDFHCAECDATIVRVRVAES